MPVIVITLGPVMRAVKPEIPRQPVVLPVLLMPVVRLGLSDHQRSTNPMVKGNVLWQRIYAHPGTAITVIVVARMQVEIDADVRIVVVIVPVCFDIIVTWCV